MRNRFLQRRCDGWALYRKSAPCCRSTSIGVGYQIGGGRLYVDAYAYHSSTAGSDVETFLCRDCGSILYARALRPEIFQSAGDAHREALRAYMEENGFLLLNAHATLPSADALGYSMETLVQPAERREAVYTKALAGRAVYLSPRAFRLLCREAAEAAHRCGAAGARGAARV